MTALALRPRAVASLVLVSVVGAVAFAWPLLAGAGSALAGARTAADAPWLFALLLGLLLAVLVAEISDGGIDAKAVALLGVLAAVAAVLRPLGPGVAGLEPMFVVIVLGGRALGPGFGFLLGGLGMFASALLTAGMGPWLPFQMLAAGWVGLGAGLLPARRLRGRAESALVAGYGLVAGLAYGLVMNLWLWPTLTAATVVGVDGALTFVPGGGFGENLARFLTFSLVTSLGWDLARGLLSAALVLVAGPAVLGALRRAARRANFAPAVTFEPAGPAGPAGPVGPVRPVEVGQGDGSTR